ncbi:metal-dependent hydrolase [Mycobacterium heidelbergense]|uniref:Metal-dependent hydrolase n=1 Tax=Mycobacterium heidelbergense TaxID=53376 RepID=A0A1X0DV32_MYCHE|nr:metal-dependent hydrolase [Mycobacterium heidelbergense]MCV7052892.1 metal-dependent hydrolase [Mycobacterium heidelbergense]ORA76263.1 metal-dependent hydrolase [Mycobacterium heidelbergense]BBZ50952.1 metal-dependent hydrolase [Mycobacterium heidelbergense]
MTSLELRRVRFDLDGDIPFIWNPQNPTFSVLTNAVSIIAIAFEKLIVAATREAIPLITDPEAKSEAEAFLRQEAQHANAHRQHIRALARRYPGLEQTLADAVRCFDRLTGTAPLDFRLAYAANLEATFTPYFKLLLDNEATLFAPGDERVASLFLWHFVEEVEHRSSALIVYDALIHNRVHRVRALPAILKHMNQALVIVVDGFNKHVPEADRIIDAHRALPALTPSALRRPRPAPPALAHLSNRQKSVAMLRILESQTPWHNPTDQPLPRFADRWFRRYNDGADIAHWYSAAAASR